MQELHLGTQGDTHNAAELVYAGLELLQSLHVLVEVQLLGHRLCLHCASPSARRAYLSASLDAVIQYSSHKALQQCNAGPPTRGQQTLYLR